MRRRVVLFRFDVCSCTTSKDNTKDNTVGAPDKRGFRSKNVRFLPVFSRVSFSSTTSFYRFNVRDPQSYTRDFCYNSFDYC